MKKLTLLGIVVGGAVLCVAPFSIQQSPRGMVELSVNKAEAQYYRRHYRRVYRRAYRRAYYGGYYGYGGYPAYSYGYPAYYGYGYGYPPYVGLGIGFGWGRRWW